MAQYRRQALVAQWMDQVNAPAYAIDICDRWPSSHAIGSSTSSSGSRPAVATLYTGDTPIRGTLQLLSTHLIIVDEAARVLKSIAIDRIHSFKRYHEVAFLNRTFADMPQFRTTLELYVAASPLHRLVLEGMDSVRVGQCLELLWRYTFGKLSSRQQAVCRGYHLGDALTALALLPLDLDCTLLQQTHQRHTVNVEKSIVLRVDENFTLSLIFRPETIAETAVTRSIDIPLDNITLITARDDELRIVVDDGRIFLLNNISSFGEGAGGGASGVSAVVSNVALSSQSSVYGIVGKPSENLMTVFFANAATYVYRHLKFRYPFFTFRHVEVAKLYEHYLCIDANGDGNISQQEFDYSLGPVFGQLRTVPKALYALCDCFGKGQIRLFDYLHGFRVLLKGNYQDRVRFLFLVFDTKRQGSITYLQFLEGLKTFAMAVDLNIPKGETIEALTLRIFNEIDINKDNTIQFEEFEISMRTNFGVIDAIKGASSAGLSDSAASSSSSSVSSNNVVNPAKILSFGHPQWHQICQILMGIQMSVANEDAHKAAPDSREAQNAKYTYMIASNSSSGPAGPGSPTNVNGGGGSSGGNNNDNESQVVSRSSGGLSLRNPFAKSGDNVTFSDYCPAVFEAIRGRFGISKKTYLASLGFSQARKSLFFGCLSALYEMSSSGRSGSFFYSSTDNRFILKTIPAAESQTLRKILPAYYAHIVKYPNTTLTRFCGLHSLVRNGLKMNFVVMQNIFLNSVPVQETFDLKGSTINRSTPADLRHLGVALKDNDFDNRKLCLRNPSLRDSLLAQLEADSRMLSSFNLNDYSFLLGIHKSLDGPLPPCDAQQTPAPKFSAFQQSYGGLLSEEGDEVYFVGIIDCLTDYGLKKMGEHLSKSVLYDSKQVSCVPPQEYQKRFIEYLSSVFVKSSATAGGEERGNSGSPTSPRRQTPSTPASTTKR